MINGRKHAARPLQGILNYASGSKRMRRRRPPSLKMKSRRLHFTANTYNTYEKPLNECILRITITWSKDFASAFRKYRCWKWWRSYSIQHLLLLADDLAHGTQEKEAWKRKNPRPTGGAKIAPFAIDAIHRLSDVCSSWFWQMYRSEWWTGSNIEPAGRTTTKIDYVVTILNGKKCHYPFAK